MSVKLSRRFAYLSSLCSNLLSEGASFEVAENTDYVVVSLPKTIVRHCYQPVSGVRKNPSRPIKIRTIFRAMMKDTGHPEVKGFRNRKLGDKIEHRIFLTRRRVDRLLSTLTTEGSAAFVLKLSKFFLKLQSGTEPEVLSGKSRKRFKRKEEKCQRQIRPRITQISRHSTLPNSDVAVGRINSDGTDCLSQSPLDIQSFFFEFS